MDNSWVEMNLEDFEKHFAIPFARLLKSKKRRMKMEKPGVDNFHGDEKPDDRARQFPLSARDIDKLESRDFSEAGSSEGKVEDRSNHQNRLCKEFMGHRIKTYERKIKSMKILLGMLPSRLTPEQDKAMWNLLIDMKL